jgi:flagellar basal-body rod modification protein FlgD
MSINITGTTSTTPTSSTASTGGSTQQLGENDFLQLLTAQLKAHDPLNPMDDTTFVAQLAQFSSLEQLTDINTELTNMASSQSSLQNTMAANLIGKTVVGTGDTVSLNGQANLSYSLQSEASQVTLSIYNSSGALVTTQTLGNEGAGTNSYTWNGTDQNGNTQPAGQYTFAVSAVNSTGQAVTATPLTTGIVTGVTLNNNVTYLTLDNNAQIQLGNVNEILGGS